MNIQEQRNKTFIEKFWAQQIRSEGVVYTWKELFEKDKPISKFYYTRQYSYKKTEGCYKKLKPKTIYAINFEGNFSRDVPKIIYNSMSLREENLS